MKTYQYTSAENAVVAVIDEDGISRMSMLASAVPQGVAIEPAPPVIITPAHLVAQIQALEDQYLMPRITRETIIALAEERAVAMGLTLEYLRAKNKGYAGLKTLDEQIAELRSQLP